MLSKRSWALLVALLWLFSSAPATWAQSAPAQWTVLIYLDGDNNLEREAIDDFLEMATVGSTAQVNVVVQFDRTPGYDRRYGDWTGALRFRVQPGMTPEPANALADLGEANMGDPQTLADFVAWGMAAFPAQHTALVLWNHGDGWRTSSLVKEGRKAICWDDTNGRDALDSAELRQAMAAVTADGARPLDLLAFDACLMAMIEVDAQLYPYVRVRTGSEETEPGTGYPYDTILTDLHAHPDWDGVALGAAIVERYYEAYGGETQSAMALNDDYAQLIHAVDGLAQALLDHQEAELQAIQEARRGAQQFQASNVDLYDLAALVSAKASAEALRTAAQATMDAIKRATVANRSGAYWSGANGVSVYFPTQPNLWDSLYAGENDYLTFTAQTHWDEFLLAYLRLAAACDPDPYEPDDDPATAPLVQVGEEPQQHNFCPATDAADWIKLELGTGQPLEATTWGLGAGCDTVLKLYGPDGTTVLAQDDDGGEGVASSITWTSPAAGTYYLQVLEYYGRTGQDTGYTLQVKSGGPACQPDEFEPDGNSKSAASLSVNGPALRRNFCPKDDQVDWVSFEAVRGQVYAVQARHLGSYGHAILQLYDMDGTTALDTDVEEEPDRFRLQWLCPADGHYFVRIHERDGHTGEETAYELTAETLSLMVSGQVFLQGRDTFSGTTIAAWPLGYTTTTTLSGTFSLTLTLTLPCTITATFPGYLGHRWEIAEAAAPELALEPVTLWGGDINDDGHIDILDIAFIGARFGGTDPQADINDDGLVDIRDLVLPAGNFGRSME